MVSHLLLLQLLLTFLIGSTWIFFILVASERFGSKIGGFIGGLPSTALLSFFFIGLTQSPVTASEATTVFPLVYSITGIFLVVYGWLSKKGFTFTLFFSLFIWFILSAIVAWINPQNFGLNLILYAFILLIAYYLMESKLKIRTLEKIRINHTLKQTALRSLFGGTIILLAVVLAKLGGPVFGGIFAAFPAMFISTLFLSYRAQGMEFSRSMTKPLMVTGMVTIVIFAVAVRYSYIKTGLYIGTLIAMAISAMSAYFTLLFIRKKLT
jgi:hypothetical protein